MRFNFRKIASTIASTALLGSTVALAAAASYPAPFVQNGQADVAIVYGTLASNTDLVAANDIAQSLSSALADQGGDGDFTIEGESYALFTGSSPLLLNASLSSVRSSITESNLPTVLADSDFSGNVDAEATFRINIGSNPRAIFAKEPSSSNDPETGILVGTTAGTYLYNSTVTFNKAVNFADAESEGEDMMLFGKEFTVASATDGNSLVLFQSADTVFLDSTTNPSESVTIGDETYTVSLVSASDTSATIRVTDSSGDTDQKEINEAASKKILGIEVAVDNADELGDGTINAQVILGANKLKFTDGSEVQVGSDEDPIEGTQVDFTGNTTTLTGLTVQVFAPSGSEDFITPGNSFPDPVFGGFEVNFIGLESDGETEDIEVKTSGNDKMTISFTNWQNKELTSWEWVNNESGNSQSMLGDPSEWEIEVRENAVINESAYAVVGNQDEGYIVKLSDLHNSSSTDYTDDRVTFQNVFDTTQSWDAVLSAEGTGTVDIGGRSYSVKYLDNRAGDDTQNVRLGYPDTSSNDMLVFPTVQTSSGAMVSFYEPLTITMNDWDGANNNVSGFVFPDGDDFASTVAVSAPQVYLNGNWTIGGVTINLTAGEQTSFTIGPINYTVDGTAVNTAKIYLNDMSNSIITRPALVVWEEKDDANNNNAVIIETGGAGTADNGVGVENVDLTWNKDTDMTGSTYGTSGLQLESNDDMYQMMDIWGTIVAVDQSTSDQYTATVSYPDDQVVAQVYITEADAVSSSGGALGDVVILDSEASSMSAKNMVVVGGSCVNTLAANLLFGSSTPQCGANWETETGVSAGEFLIQTFDSPLSGSKVATLVAGYNAEDTTNAAAYLTGQTVDTTVGSKYIGTSATQAELQ